MLRTVVCSVLLLAATAAGQEKTVPIQLHRPSKAGERYYVKLSASRAASTVVTIGGRVANNNSKTIKVEFEGVFEILAVNDTGGSTHVRALVRRLVVDDDGTVTEPLVAGDRFEAVREGDSTSYSMTDRSIPEALESALRLVVSTDSGGPTDDECFGPKEAPALGDTWEGSAEATAKSLAKSSIVVAPEDIRTTIQLEKLETHWKVPCHRLLLRMTAENVRPSEGSTPEGLTAGKGSVEAEWTDVRPVDPKLSHSRQSVKYTVNMVMRGVNARAGLELNRKVTVEQTEEHTRLR